MNVIPLFPTPLVQLRINRNITEKELAFVSSLTLRSNTFNSSSVDRYVLKQHALKDIRAFIESSLDVYMNCIYSPKNKVNVYITQSWTNLTKSGERHHKHNHFNSVLSGVFYLKADPSKDRIFFHRDDRIAFQSPSTELNPFNSDSSGIPVSTGDLLIFPSHLNHMVETVSGADRVSLAFNTYLKGHIGEENDLTALYIEPSRKT